MIIISHTIFIISQKDIQPRLAETYKTYKEQKFINKMDY